MDGEVHCRHLLIISSAKISGPIQADRVVVEGTVEGAIVAGLVVKRRPIGNQTSSGRIPGTAEESLSQRLPF